MTTTAAARPSRSLLRLLGVLSAVIGLLAGSAGSASASTASRSGSSSRLTHVAGLETRVGVAADPGPLFVGLQPTIAAGQVGEKCPRFLTIVSGSCVATNSGSSVVRVASGTGGVHGEMSVVRTIAKGEKIAGIVDEVKGLSYATGNEYAVVKLADGSRAIVTGGPGGITFGEGQVTRIFGHTHPFPASGVPSPADIRMLEQIGQKSSWIISRDGTIKFGSGG